MSTTITRRLGALIALLAVAMTLSVPVNTPEALAATNTINFGGGAVRTTAGPNGVIAIDGSLAYDDQCRHGGQKDFFYAASDVYIVPTGVSDGDELNDVSDVPNTIVAPGSMFLGEVIGIVTPSGTLGAGLYDVVYDTCQNGKVDFPEDTVFAEAIHVPLFTELPPAATQTGIKQKARAEYESWRNTRLGMKALNKLANMGIKRGCGANVAGACVSKAFSALEDVQDRFDGLLANMARHYDGIAHDPADPDFRFPTTLTVDTTSVPTALDPFSRTVAALGDAVAVEGALAEAFLHAIERYQGAEAAGDAHWALVHAREARTLATAQADAADATVARLQDLRGTFAAIGDFDAIHADARRFHGEVWRRGFTIDQRRAMRNQGLSDAEVTVVENEIAATPQVGMMTAADYRALLQTNVNAHIATAAALRINAAAWADIAARIEPAASAPHAHAGGLYRPVEATPVVLDATASTAPAGQTLTDLVWDLDGDGAFDDAVGAQPTATFTSGVHVVGVRVTASGGGVAVAYALVDAAEANRPPVVTTATPMLPVVTLAVGDTADFTVEAGDPDGDPVTVAWLLDDVPVGSTATFAYTPAPGAVGSHRLTAVVADGIPTGGATTHRWAVNVEKVDGDGDGWSEGADCDDTRADVHPAATELAGNGVDDDCDPATPDVPPGGVEGRVVMWGSGVLGQLGNGSTANRPSPGYVPDITDAAQVETAFRAGYLRRGDGTVLSWGSNFNGELGNGTTTHTSRPGPVRAVGGTAGSTLTGVTQLSAGGGSTHVLARRHDGTAVGWGVNTRGSLGDGSDVLHRTFPVRVLNSDGSPLRNIRAVEAGAAESFALLDDGSVVTWGATRCMNGPDGDTPHPVAFAKLTEPIAQISSSANATMFLAADGEVLTCGTTASTGYTPVRVAPFGPGSGIVRIESGSAARLALHADGRVFAWGRNTNGELDVIGAAPSQLVTVPTVVPLPEGPPVVAIAHNDACHITALRADGSVLGWGCNSSGQVGIGNTVSRIGTATPIAIPDDMVAVEAYVSGWNSIVLVHPPGATVPGTPVPTPQLPEVTLDDAALVEGVPGGFAVTLSEPSPTPVEITYRLVEDSAGADDLDHTAGSVTIPAGERHATLPVVAVADGIDEPEEAFTVVIDHADGATLGARSALAGIADADPTPVASVSGPTTVTEGSHGVTGVVFTIELSAPSAHDVRIGYVPVAGTASVPGDVQVHPGDVWLPPGALSAEVHAAVMGDTEIEPNETFGLRLADADHAVADPAPAMVSIVDDEPVIIDITSPVVTEGDHGATAAGFTLAARGVPSGETVTVPYRTEDGTAVAPADYQPATGELVLTADSSSATVQVMVNGDTDVEIDETFRLTTGPASVSDGRPVFVGDVRPAVIRNDDTEGTPDDLPPVVDAGADTEGSEGTAIVLSGSVVDDGEHTVTWSTGAEDCVFADPGAVSTTLTCVDDGAVLVELTADDGVNPEVSDHATVVVVNVAPLIGTVTWLEGTLTVPFSDPGTADTHRCIIDWGDGTEPTTVDMATSPCVAPHLYPPSTRATVQVTVEDDDGAASVRETTVETGPDGEAGPKFLAPVTSPPKVNDRVIAGKNVPLKWTLGGDHGLGIIVDGYPRSIERDCATGALIGDPKPAAASTRVPLTYHADADEYRFSWKTDPEWQHTCRTVELRLVDGTLRTAWFAFN